VVFDKECCISGGLTGLGAVWIFKFFVFLDCKTGAGCPQNCDEKIEMDEGIEEQEKRAS